jgi:hypothetical protein
LGWAAAVFQNRRLIGGSPKTRIFLHRCQYPQNSTLGPRFIAKPENHMNLVAIADPAMVFAP